MGKRLPNSDAFTIDRHSDEPVDGKLEICHCCMLESSVTVWANDQQVGRVMTDLWVKMVYFKVRFAVPFFESEQTKLTLPLIQFSRQNADSRGYTLVALGRTRRYPWTWLARPLLSNPQ